MGGDDQRLSRRGSFDEDPDNYQAARPGYPRRVYEVLADYGLRPGARVLEIGPGTGQVTRPLVAAGASVLAVELGGRLAARLRTNLAGDEAPETALVFGRQLVVVGPGVQNGTSWLFYEIPAPNDADLLSVEAADVTGDRRAEILVRVRQTFGEVRREVLLVHAITERAFPRLLQVEVSRSQGESSIANQVRTNGGRLEILPGRATGAADASGVLEEVHPGDGQDPVDDLGGRLFGEHGVPDVGRGVEGHLHNRRRGGGRRPEDPHREAEGDQLVAAQRPVG